jgi:hypothetical protein
MVDQGGEGTGGGQGRRRMVTRVLEKASGRLIIEFFDFQERKRTRTRTSAGPRPRPRMPTPTRVRVLGVRPKNPKP